MKSCSCGIIILLISINTVLALGGLILGTFAIIRFQQMETSIASLQKLSRFDDLNTSLGAIQLQLNNQIETKIRNTLLDVIPSGNLTTLQCTFTVLLNSSMINTCYFRTPRTYRTPWWERRCWRKRPNWNNRKFWT